MVEGSWAILGTLFCTFFDSYFRCFVDQMVVKIMRINLWEVVWEQGHKAEIWRFYVLVSPVVRGVSSASMTAPGVQTWLWFCYSVSPDMHVIPLTRGRMPCVSGVLGEEKKKFRTITVITEKKARRIARMRADASICYGVYFLTIF